MPQVPGASSLASCGPLGPPSRILALISSMVTSTTAVDRQVRRRRGRVITPGGASRKIARGHGLEHHALFILIFKNAATTKAHHTAIVGGVILGIARIHQAVELRDGDTELGNPEARCCSMRLDMPPWR